MWGRGKFTPLYLWFLPPIPWMVWSWIAYAYCKLLPRGLKFLQFLCWKILFNIKILFIFFLTVMINKVILKDVFNFPENLVTDFFPTVCKKRILDLFFFSRNCMISSARLLWRTLFECVVCVYMYITIYTFALSLYGKKKYKAISIIILLLHNVLMLKNFALFIAMLQCQRHP